MKRNQWIDWNTINAMCLRRSSDNIYYHFSLASIRFFLLLNWYHTRQRGTFRSSVVIFRVSRFQWEPCATSSLHGQKYLIPSDKSRKQSRKSDLPIAKYKCSLQLYSIRHGSWPISFRKIFNFQPPWSYKLIFNN